MSLPNVLTLQLLSFLPLANLIPLAKTCTHLRDLFRRLRYRRIINYECSAKDWRDFPDSDYIHHKWEYIVKPQLSGTSRFSSRFPHVDVLQSNGMVGSAFLRFCLPNASINLKAFVVHANIRLHHLPWYARHVRGLNIDYTVHWQSDVLASLNHGATWTFDIPAENYQTVSDSAIYILTPTIFLDTWMQYRLLQMIEYTDRYIPGLKNMVFILRCHHRDPSLSRSSTTTPTSTSLTHEEVAKNVGNKYRHRDDDDIDEDAGDEVIEKTTIIKEHAKPVCSCHKGITSLYNSISFNSGAPYNPWLNNQSIEETDRMVKCAKRVRVRLVLSRDPILIHELAPSKIVDIPANAVNKITADTLDIFDRMKQRTASQNTIYALDMNSSVASDLDTPK